MNRSLLLALVALATALAVGGLLLIEAVNVPETAASAAITNGAIRVAVGTLLVTGPLVRSDIPRAVAVALWLLAGSFFADAWTAVRLEAPNVHLLSLAFLAGASITLLIHASQRPRQR